MPDAAPDSADPRWRHAAVFYRSAAEYVRALVPFVRSGLARNTPVAVAVPEPRLSLLQVALGADAERVRLIDMRVAGRNPTAIIAGVLRSFADAHPEAGVRIVGEPVWPGRSAAEYPACVQHEALIDRAFSGRPARILCPYDAGVLDARVLQDVRTTHPVVAVADRWQDSAQFAPERAFARYNEPLTDAAGAAVRTVADPRELREVRAFVGAVARRLGLSADRAGDVELVADELVANSLVHAGGNCRLALWRHGEQVVCSVRDGGTLSDPLAGRRPPEPDGTGGRGLLLVNHLADLVRMHTGPHATTIQAYLPSAG